MSELESGQQQEMATLSLPVSTRRDHIQGRPDSPVTLVEYGDYECPYCGQAYAIIKKIQEGLRGQLRFVFRNFPLINYTLMRNKLPRLLNLLEHKKNFGICTIFYM
jgi:protein-disulfide isomerase